MDLDSLDDGEAAAGAESDVVIAAEESSTTLQLDELDIVDGEMLELDDLAASDGAPESEVAPVPVPVRATAIPAPPPRAIPLPPPMRGIGKPPLPPLAANAIRRTPTVIRVPALPPRSPIAARDAIQIPPITAGGEVSDGEFRGDDSVGDSTMALDLGADGVELEASDSGNLARVQADADGQDRSDPDDLNETSGAEGYAQTLASPTVVEQALAELDDAGLERRADALTAAIDSAGDPRLAAQLAYELGELCERRLADEARAIKAYGRAIAEDPSHRANLWAIRRVFYRRQLWPNLVKLLDAEVRYARDDADRADLLVEKGRVLAVHSADRDQARIAFTEARAAEPSHLGALLELERLAWQDGDDGRAELLETLVAQAELSTSAPRRCALWIEVARLRTGQGDLPSALEALAEASATGLDAERIVEERVRVAEQYGDPDVLLAALDEQVTSLLGRFGVAGGPATELLSEAGGNPNELGRDAFLRRELVAVRRRQSQVAQAADNGDEAWDYLQHALALLPAEPLLLADLVELADKLNKPAELSEVLERWISVETDPSRQLILRLRRVDALLRAGATEPAELALAELNAQLPGFVALTGMRERTAIAGHDSLAIGHTWLAAAGALRLGSSLGPDVDATPERAAAAATYVAAATIFLAATPSTQTAASVSDDELLVLAERALESAVEAVPDFLPAIDLFIEVDERRDDLAAASGRLVGLAERSQGPALHSALERLAALRRGRGDLEGALQAARQLAALTPDDLTLGWQIESLLAHLGHDKDRAEHLERLAVAEPDPSRRQHAVSMAARLWERQGDLEGALRLYQQALGYQPDDEFSRASVLDLLRASGRWLELVAARQAQVAALPNGPDVRRALREAAWVLEVRLDRPGEASRCWQAMLDRDPDDTVAQGGLLRCRQAQGDVPAQIDLLTSRVAEGDTDWVQAAVNLSWLHETRGELDRASELLRDIADRAPVGSVAANYATWTLIEHATLKGDTETLQDRHKQMAIHSSSSQLHRALSEDLGWLRGLALDDDLGSAESFAIAAGSDDEPSHAGARLGAALIAARRGDPHELRAAFVSMARSLSSPKASAALYLRSAAIAIASGDEPSSEADVLAARHKDPDDVGAMLVAAESFTSPRFGGDNDADYIGAMIERADLIAMRADLAADPRARASWELDRALALEHAGRLADAGRVVASVLRSDPDNMRALEALRRISYVGGDVASAARATYQIAKRLGDPAARLVRLREAAAIFDPLDAQTPQALAARDTGAAITVYRRILSIERGGPEFVALLAALRAEGDAEGTISAITEQLGWLAVDGENRLDADPDAPLALLLERATVRHGRGDALGAIADLDSVLALDTNRADALRFRGDLALTQGDSSTAVDMWRRYLEVEHRGDRRTEVEQQLAKLLAESTSDLTSAVAELAKVIERNRDDVGLHERMLGLASRAADHKTVITTLVELARLRRDPIDKAKDERRIATVALDKLGDRVVARAALERARKNDPANLDVVRELAALLDNKERAQLLEKVLIAQRKVVDRAPGAAESYDALSSVAELAGNVDLRWLSLGILREITTLSAGQRQALAKKPAAPTVPSGRFTDAQWKKIVSLDEPAAPLTALWKLIAPAINTSLGLEPTKLGFARGDRLALKKIRDRLPVMASVFTAMGIDDAEVWISDKRKGFGRVLAGDVPVICLGTDVAAGEGAAAMFTLGRCAQLASAAAGALPEFRDIEVAWFCAAALRASDVPLPPGLAGIAVDDDTAISERTRLLSKAFGRRDKKNVAAWATGTGGAPAVTSLQIDPPTLATWRRLTVGLANRVGLLLSGDPEVALELIDAGRSGRAIEDSTWAQDLARWTVSENHVALRTELTKAAL